MWRRPMWVVVGLTGSAASLLAFAVLRGTTHLEDSLWGRALEAVAMTSAAMSVGLVAARVAPRRRPDAETTADPDGRE